MQRTQCSCFPGYPGIPTLSLALVAAALHRLGHRWQGAVVLLAALAWPVAHIANVASVAVSVDVALVVALGSLVRPIPGARESAGPEARRSEGAAQNG